MSTESPWNVLGDCGPSFETGVECCNSNTGIRHSFNSRDGWQSSQHICKYTHWRRLEQPLLPAAQKPPADPFLTEDRAAFDTWKDRNVSAADGFFAGRRSLRAEQEALIDEYTKQSIASGNASQTFSIPSHFMAQGWLQTAQYYRKLMATIEK